MQDIEKLKKDREKNNKKNSDLVGLWCDGFLRIFMQVFLLLLALRGQ